MSDDLNAVRSEIIAFLRREFIGPCNGVTEVLTEEVNKVYTAGILYPRKTSTSAVLQDEEEDIAGTASNAGIADLPENQADEPIVLANQHLPSSMGLSFYLRGEPAMDVQVCAGQYRSATVENDGFASGSSRKTRKAWRRHPLWEPGDGWLHLQMPTGRNTLKVQVLEGTAQLQVVWRQGKDGWLVTVTVINIAEGQEYGIPDAEKCLCQVELHCRTTGDGFISAYPKPRILSDDPEDQILDLLYRRYVAFGVGHGCSVNWDSPTDGRVHEIWAEILPTQEVSPISYALPGFDKVLSLAFLAEGSDVDLRDWIAELNRFVQGYRGWVDGLRSFEDPSISKDLQETRNALLTRMEVTADRMEKGVCLLEQDPVVRKAFALANMAMLQQMQHSTEEYAGKRHKAAGHVYREPAPDRGVRWRPFQLAFQLLTIGSVADPNDLYRQIVDLIWFPTGGGKTEAYLAVTAFIILYRRLHYKDAGVGTAVLMCYTLRLLTTQQFQRAATLICALERMRRMAPELLGFDEISIGLWVGSATSPNRYSEALQKYEALLDEETPKSPFQIDRCPWCGTELVPAKRSRTYGLYGFKVSQTLFEMYCPNSTCPFHDHLPVGVVDEQLYEQSPSLLLATVDKFARLPWESRASAFFGNESRRAPDLIIQDELHLISGPLGTIVGAYESAIEGIVAWEGHAPKILASTATIRRAGDQCKGLYARRVELFPPSGLDASDSYFSRYDASRPGRVYCGVMGPGHTVATTMIRVCAALLQAPVELHLSGDAQDAYWTLVAYHNSLRELGKVLTYAADDIPARIKVIAQDERIVRAVTRDNTAELTSNIDASDLMGMLQRLNRRAGEDDEVTFLACTNMLSVGVDIQRLGLMVVNGQPKSTSEYIQATSRVGRGQVPGLIVTVLSPSKPCDRSHYERFIAYHSALYRQVEPTSVTPFAQPARDRALHAALVSLLRHKGQLPENADAASLVRESPELQRAIAYLLDRVNQVDAREKRSTAAQLWELVTTWEKKAKENENLEYYNSNRSVPVLLKNTGDDRRDGWETLQSMRSVDRECVIRVLGE